MYIGFGHLTSAIGFYGNLQPFKTNLLIFFISISKSYSVNSSNPLRLSLTFALGIYVVKGSSPVQIPLTVNETPFIQQVSTALKNRIKKRDELTDSKIIIDPIPILSVKNAWFIAVVISLKNPTSCIFSKFGRR